MDDEPLTARGVARLLGIHGLHARTCSTAAEALRPGAVDAYDVVLLDIRLGDESGLDACSELRAAGYEGGIIMLSGISSTHIKSAALLAGADDYVTKPFQGEELWARIEAVVRRYRRTSGPLLEIQGHSVHVRGEPVRLTNRERQILIRISRAEGSGVPRAELVSLLEVADPEHALDVYISRIRKKLGRASSCLNVVDGRYWLDAASRQR